MRSTTVFMADIELPAAGNGPFMVLDRKTVGYVARGRPLLASIPECRISLATRVD